MGKIIRNGIEYSGTYDDANSVNYDNSVSGLDARTVQEGIDQLNSNLGGLRFGYDGDSNSYGYYGADDSFVPFSQGCKLLWADYEVTSQEKGVFINVDLSGYSKVIVSLDYSRDGGAPLTRYVLDVGGTYKIWGVNASGSANYRTLTISTSGISIDAYTSVNRAILTEVYGWEESENNDYVYSGNFLGVFYSNVNSTFTFDTSLVGDSCILAIVQYNSNNTSTVAQMTAYENCTVELLQNTMNSYHSIYVYKITDIVEGAYIKHSGSRNILLFK